MRRDGPTSIPNHTADIGKPTLKSLNFKLISPLMPFQQYCYNIITNELCGVTIIELVISTMLLEQGAWLNNRYLAEYCVGICEIKARFRIYPYIRKPPCFMVSKEVYCQISVISNCRELYEYINRVASAESEDQLCKQQHSPVVSDFGSYFCSTLMLFRYILHILSIYRSTSKFPSQRAHSKITPFTSIPRSAVISNALLVLLKYPLS